MSVVYAPSSLFQVTFSLSFFFHRATYCQTVNYPRTLQVEETSKSGTKSASQTNRPIGDRQSAAEIEAIYCFLFLFLNQLPFLAIYLTNTPHPGKLPSPDCHVVSECQLSFAPPRELQANVTLSYMQCVKTRHRANGRRSVQNQVKCRRLYSILSDCYN